MLQAQECMFPTRGFLLEYYERSSYLRSEHAKLVVEHQSLIHCRTVHAATWPLPLRPLVTVTDSNEQRLSYLSNHTLQKDQLLLLPPLLLLSWSQAGNIAISDCSI